MPVKKRRFEEPSRVEFGPLYKQLAEELKSESQFGQPTVYQEEYPTGKIRVVVTWDQFDGIPMEERTGIILRAYSEAFGEERRNQVALASGLTIPEAYSAAMLPFQIIPALRKGDPVTEQECHKAMVEEGASLLLSKDRPLLRFQTEEDAEAAKQRLIQRLPGSDAVWVITQDVGTVEHWADA